jgi:hypothetical protein
MKRHEKIDLMIMAEDGKLLTQSADIPADERIFSSRVYDSNMENWTEWTQEQVDKFIKERDKTSEEVEDTEPKEE